MEVKQSQSFLMSLVADVAAGRMLPAAMQRPYVWSKHDVEALCDSIVSGFPIGAFLMWAPGNHADLAKLSKGRLGPIAPAPESAVNAFHPYCLLLDGQNRLATFAWMMRRDDAPVPFPVSEAERETWLGDACLVLDFETRSVRFVPKAEATVGLRLPAWTLMSAASTEMHHEANFYVRQLWQHEWPKRFSNDQVDDFFELWDQVRARFAGARTAETVIADATPAEARHAFLRICRVGVPMSQEDFDRAIGWMPDQ